MLSVLQVLMSRLFFFAHYCKQIQFRSRLQTGPNYQGYLISHVRVATQVQSTCTLLCTIHNNVQCILHIHVYTCMLVCDLYMYTYSPISSTSQGKYPTTHPPSSIVTQTQIPNTITTTMFACFSFYKIYFLTFCFVIIITLYFIDFLLYLFI